MMYTCTTEVKFRDRKQNVVAKGWKRGENGKLLFNEYRVSVWEDEKVLQTQRHNGVNALNATELYLKHG